MRSSRVLILAAVAFLAACGDSNGPSNPVPTGTAPTATFSSECTDLTCDFTDQSTDSDVGGSIASRSWDFGDGTPANTTPNPQHVYTAAGTYGVVLIVTDNAGNKDTASSNVTVTAPVAGAPTAKFTVSCVSADCTVTESSTDGAPGTVTGWAWDFGDGSPVSNVQNPPVHHYTVTGVTTFTITLTVTDNDGLTGTATKQISVAPPTGLTCNGASCTLGLDVNSTVMVTLESVDCEAHGNTFVITAPIVDTLFTDGCFAAPGTQFPLDNGGSPVFNAGTQLDAEVLSGISGVANTGPQLRVTGDFTNGWKLEFDDGFQGAGEPDFNDLVIRVKATAQ
jgi:PKD repeat protein